MLESYLRGHLKKIEANAPPSPLIGPTIVENETAVPNIEDDNYSEHDRDSDDDTNYDVQEDLDVENEVDPEDGLTWTPGSPVARYVKNRILWFDYH